MLLRNFVALLTVLGLIYNSSCDSQLKLNSPIVCNLPASLSAGVDVETSLDGSTNIATQHQSSYSKVIAIGDVHGSFQGLLEVLFHANVTKFPEICQWNPSISNTLVVQVGDIVDRGPQALEAWSCLDSLQDSTPHGSKLVRLLGNHEIWWLEGHFHHRNEQYDTQHNVKTIVDKMRKGIESGNIVGSFVHKIGIYSVIFTHSGLRPEYLSYLESKIGPFTVDDIATYINTVLYNSIRDCKTYRCAFEEETFEAGKDRGGSHIGGPFWTDFSVIEDASRNHKYSNIPMIQVAGHTMAWCYDRRRPGIDPPMEVAECALGLVRATENLDAFCVDGGMYVGARAYLEIDSRNHFIRHQKFYGEWSNSDLTDSACK